MAEEASCADDTALGALLRIVEDRLLVVELPRDRAQTIYVKGGVVSRSESSQAAEPPTIIQTTPTSEKSIDSTAIIGRLKAKQRATSGELLDVFEREIMDIYVEDDHSDDWWFRDGPRQPLPAFTSRPPGMVDEPGHLFPGTPLDLGIPDPLHNSPGAESEYPLSSS
jgi:hypothetical protein